MSGFHIFLLNQKRKTHKAIGIYFSDILPSLIKGKLLNKYEQKFKSYVYALWKKPY